MNAERLGAIIGPLAMIPLLGLSVQANTIIVMSSRPEEVVVIDAPELVPVRNGIIDLLVVKLREEVAFWSGDSTFVLLAPSADAFHKFLPQVQAEFICFPHVSMSLTHGDTGPYVRSEMSLRMVTVASGDTLTSVGAGSAGSTAYEGSDGGRAVVHSTLDAACVGSVIAAMRDTLRKLKKR